MKIRPPCLVKSYILAKRFSKPEKAKLELMKPIFAKFTFIIGRVVDQKCRCGDAVERFRFANRCLQNFFIMIYHEKMVLLGLPRLCENSRPPKSKECSQLNCADWPLREGAYRARRRYLNELNALNDGLKPTTPTPTQTHTHTHIHTHTHMHAHTRTHTCIIPTTRLAPPFAAISKKNPAPQPKSSTAF